MPGYVNRDNSNMRRLLNVSDCKGFFHKTSVYDAWWTLKIVSVRKKDNTVQSEMKYENFLQFKSISSYPCLTTKLDFLEKDQRNKYLAEPGKDIVKIQILETNQERWLSYSNNKKNNAKKIVCKAIGFYGGMNDKLSYHKKRFA